ncbi:SDR family oxidoreductase [Caldibacillus lycopersici]|uniref:SDR family oxidoreductase n=1 Tax=Perspicuibacillus lycopersici TaxID=1325689 RepID=A0AAE3IWA2_9BACI|nr:SDR family oxidoreductase [Perspicuibacillus lycopersici]MCU9614569.1 SDR family oxidoreductase [Perspicuibacillus lycopersici]
MNKVVLITGAATGLGRATALKLAAQGYRLSLVDYNEKDGQATAEEAKMLGAEVIFVKANVASEADVKHYVAQTVASFGTIDYFHNNAGIMLPFRLLHEYSSEEYDRLMNINLKGAFLGIKYVIPVMIENGGGVIINTVSSNSFKPTAFNGIYAASKHALAGLTKSIGQDYQDLNIFAVGVAPNTMQTNISAQAISTYTEEIGAKIAATTAPNIPATAEEIADVVIFAMNGAKTLNGSIVNCAGGQIYI